MSRNLIKGDSSRISNLSSNLYFDLDITDVKAGDTFAVSCSDKYYNIGFSSFDADLVITDKDSNRPISNVVS